MAFQVGDRPAEPMHVSSYSVDLTRYSTAYAMLIAPAGDVTPLLNNVDGDEIVVEFRNIAEATHPSVSLDEAGIWSLSLTAFGNEPSVIQQRALPVVRFVVEPMESEWHTLSSARDADWPDARDMNDMTLYELLESAKHDVLEFAPVLDEGEAVPVNYRMAQLAHARNRWNAALADPSSGDFGGEGFAIPARPLDWQIKQMLRPSTGVPAGF